MNRLGLALLPLLGCAAVQRARPVDTPQDFARLGLSETVIAPWEDGRRSDGRPGAFEWWYFDAHLDDGSTLVVVFYDKPLSAAEGGLAPGVRVDLTRADGSTASTVVAVSADAFSSAKEGCDVRVGPHRFQGDLRRYQVTVRTAELSVDLTLEGLVPAWRPAAGAIAFGDGDEKKFWWLAAVPQGRVAGTLTTAQGTTAITGVGYHDHNWGDAPLTELVHDWYWGRAQVGAYTVIASFITAHERYGGLQFPVFLLAKDGEVLAQDARKVRFSSAGTSVDEETRKPWASHLVWDFVDEGRRYRVTFDERKRLVRARLVEGLPGVLRLGARLAGLDPAYMRFGGVVTVEELDGETVVRKERNTAAVWELMYLGNPRRAW